jgi:nitroreductase
LFDTEVTDRLLTTTRSVRRRLALDVPVDPAVVLDCLRIAIQAPSGGNRQGWHWLVVTDPDRRAAVAEIYRAAGRPAFERLLESAASGSSRQAYRDAIYLAENLERVPVLVLACVEGRLDPSRASSLTTRAAALYASVLPAVWNLQLALHSRGLGSVLTTAHLAREAEMAALLGIPDDVTQVALLPVAAVAGSFRPARRKPLEEVVHLNRWDSGG